MSGFWAGFAQGYGEEKDRQEARKQYQDALDLKKKDMAMQIIQRRAELGMTNPAEGDSELNGSARALASYGASPDIIASLAKSGGSKALKEAADIVRQYADANSTPEAINSLLTGITIDVSGGEAVDVEAIAAQGGITFTPQESELASLMGTSKREVTVIPPLKPAKALSLDEISKAQDLAEANLGDSLNEAILNNNRAMAAATDDNEKKTLIAEGERLSAAKTDFDQGVKGPARRLVGTNAMSAVIANFPALADSPIIQSYGKDSAVETPQAPTAETATTPQTQTYTELGKDFATAAEAQAAFDAGQIPLYSKFSVAGVTKWYPSGQ